MKCFMNCVIFLQRKKSLKKKLLNSKNKGVFIIRVIVRSKTKSSSKLYACVLLTIKI